MVTYRSSEPNELSGPTVLLWTAPSSLECVTADFLRSRRPALTSGAISILCAIIGVLFSEELYKLLFKLTLDIPPPPFLVGPGEAFFVCPTSPNESVDILMAPSLSLLVLLLLTTYLFFMA